MSEENPFAVSEFSGAYDPAAASDPNMNPEYRDLIRLLVETRPWVRFIGIMTLIGAAFMVLGGLGMLLGSAAGQAGGRFLFIGVLYLVMAVLYIYPAVCLMKYASSITNAETSRQLGNVNEAILHQKKFWRFCGILMAVIVAVYALGIIGGALFFAIG